MCLTPYVFTVNTPHVPQSRKSKFDRIVKPASLASSYKSCQGTLGLRSIAFVLPHVMGMGESVPPPYTHQLTCSDVLCVSPACSIWRLPFPTTFVSFLIASGIEDGGVHRFHFTVNVALVPLLHEVITATVKLSSSSLRELNRFTAHSRWCPTIIYRVHSIYRYKFNKNRSLG